MQAGTYRRGLAVLSRKERKRAEGRVGFSCAGEHRSLLRMNRLGGAADQRQWFIPLP
jgi:hypothetical protein